MTIEIRKKSPQQCVYKITRDDHSVELITLDTKTYLLHDICHYVVEKHLKYAKGFWGMLSLGHSFQALFGKNNPQTTELRFIEQIVGPVQSVYCGYIPKQHFEEYISHLDFTIAEEVLNSCLIEINIILDRWTQLPVGQEMTLVWDL